MFHAYATVLFTSCSLFFASSAVFADNLSVSNIPDVHITYKHSGNRAGTSDVWWSEKGGRVASLQKLSLPGRENYISYWDGNQTIIRATPDRRVVTNLHRTSIHKPSPVAEWSPAERQSMGWSFTGNQMEISGKQCDLWHQPAFGGKTCIWKGLELLWIEGVNGDSYKYKREAVEITEGESIPSHFSTMK